MGKRQDKVDIKLWTAFERLSHAYRVGDDAAADRELDRITRLRERSRDRDYRRQERNSRTGEPPIDHRRPERGRG